MGGLEGVAQVEEVGDDQVDMEVAPSEEEVKQVRVEVDALLHGATETLGATQGAEGLRMLQTRLARHFDD